MSVLGAIKRNLFGFDLSQVRYERLGFHIGEPKTHERLQRVIDCFIHSYNLGLENDPRGQRVSYLLNMMEPDLVGFAHEGAAMAFAVTDIFRTRRRSVSLPFAHEIAHHHSYMAYIGIGMALSATHRTPTKLWSALDPFTRWLVWDGIGFHNAFFRSDRTLLEHRLPQFVTDEHAVREFDAGVGRALWFIECGNPMRLQRTVNTFPEARRADLWAGIGLACAYACGVDASTLQEVVQRAGPHQECLAQGAVLAAHARHRAGNPVAHLDRASRVIWGLDSHALHVMAEEAIAETADVDEDSAGLPRWLAFVERLRRGYWHRQSREVA